MTTEAMGWNDEISNDSSFTLLPPADYPFTVSKFERGVHSPKPGGKLPECNKAILTLDVNGQTSITHTLFLHRSMEWKLAEFFRAIGSRKHGETFAMNWQTITGKTGRCKIGVREYTYQGEDREANEIVNFLDPAIDDSDTDGMSF